VRLHVAAKRYLATLEPGYFDRLSAASHLSLKLQGGLMAPDEALAFAAVPFSKEAIALRRWDDEGKVAGMGTPGLDHFLRHLDSLERR
jgi:predicted HD phosphohydrolase